jgi:lysophospholipase L1-like esterase
MMRRTGLYAALIGLVAMAMPKAMAGEGDIMYHGIKVNKVLFLGNSITKHGPSKKVSWTGNWGMAASAEDKDYVHLVLLGLAKEAGAEPKAVIANVAKYEREYATYDLDAGLAKEFAFKPDLVIVAIGENVPTPQDDAAKKALQASISTLLRKLKANGNPTIVVRTCFWPSAPKDAILKKGCAEIGGILVDAGPLGKVEANFARSEREFAHKGVAAHPGDRGMKAIAEAILKALAEAGE